MNTSLKNFFLVPFLIAGLGLILAAPAEAHRQFFVRKFRPRIPPASLNNSAGNTFQYTNAANLSDDKTYLPLCGTTATFFTTSNGWTASLNVNIAA